MYFCQGDIEVGRSIVLQPSQNVYERSMMARAIINFESALIDLKLLLILSMGFPKIHQDLNCNLDLPTDINELDSSFEEKEIRIRFMQIRHTRRDARSRP